MSLTASSQRQAGGCGPGVSGWSAGWLVGLVILIFFSKLEHFVILSSLIGTTGRGLVLLTGLQRDLRGQACQRGTL